MTLTYDKLSTLHYAVTNVANCTSVCNASAKSSTLLSLTQVFSASTGVEPLAAGDPILLRSRAALQGTSSGVATQPPSAR